MEKHVFSLFYADLQSLLKACQPDGRCLLADKDVVCRLTSVLRLRQGESFILFDQYNHVTCSVLQAQGRSLAIAVQQLVKNEVIQPDLTCLLPVLRREAFEEAIYGLTELGVNRVCLMVTAKVQRSWGGQKELERIQRITHAAAEQSKNFAFPVIEPPLALETCLQRLSPTVTQRFFCDPEGISFAQCVARYATQPTAPCALMIGPEGDLNETEKALVMQYKFEKVALTPTILRAQQAVVVATGALRSMVRVS